MEMLGISFHIMTIGVIWLVGAGSFSVRSFAEQSGNPRPVDRVECHTSINQEELLNPLYMDENQWSEFGGWVANREAGEISELAAHREDLVRMGAPDTALGKYDRAIRERRERYQRLKSALRSPAGGLTADQSQSVSVELNALGLLSDHQPFDAEQLTYRRPVVPAAEPGQDADSHKAMSQPPMGADLAETADAPFTPRIQELAAKLDHNPVLIFNWVRNNINYLPVHGSLKGADYALLTREGTDFDQASLLVALLRVSGIPARYVYGTMEVPEGDIKEWIDVTSLKAAGDLLITSGAPVLIVGTQLDQRLRMERCWVLAWVNNTAGRGLEAGTGDAWVPLDPSFKRYERIAPKVAAPPVDAEAFVAGLIASSTVDTANSRVTGLDPALIHDQMQAWQNALTGAIQNQNPNATTQDLVGERRILEVDLNTLPSAPAFPPTGILFVESAIPDRYRYRLTLEVGDKPFIFPFAAEFSAARWLPEVAGKRLTLSHRAASAEDHALLEALYPDAATATWEEFPDQYQTAGIDVVPSLQIEGATAARGTPRAFGLQREFHLVFESPETGNPARRTKWTVINDIRTGGTYAIALDLGHTPQEAALDRFRIIQSQERRLAVEPLGNFTGESILGERLFASAVNYLAESDRARSFTAWNQNVASPGYLGQVMAFTPLRMSGSQAEFGGISLDVDLSLEISTDRAGQPATEALNHFLTASGMMGSALESSVLDALLVRSSTQPNAVSTVRILEEALLQGVPIYTITPANRAATVPQLALPQEILRDINAGLDAGRHITVPQRQVTLQYGGGVPDYTGVGFVAMDPETGAASYIIAGGISGGYRFDAGLKRLNMLVNGDWEGFKRSVAQGVKDMIRQRPLEFVAVPLVKIIIFALMSTVLAPLLTAFGIAGVTAFLVRTVVMVVVSEIIVALANLRF